MKSRKMMGTVGIVLAIVLVFIIIWAVMSGENSDLAMSSDKTSGQEATQTNIPSNASQAPSLAQDSSTPGSATSDSNTSDSSAEFKKYLREQDDILSDMIEDMKDEEPEGNAAEDYLESMIDHHEATIDMAKNYLKYAGTNSKFKQTAEELITAQTKQLQEMELLNDEIEDTLSKDTTKEQEYLNTYNKILSEHPYARADSSSAADVEQSFIETMTVHHQMAIDLSTAILDYTSHDGVRKLANQIIEESKTILQSF